MSIISIVVTITNVYENSIVGLEYMDGLKDYLADCYCVDKKDIHINLVMT